MSSCHAKLSGLVVVIMIALGPAGALAQARLEREGVVLYWGLVPAAVASQKHALEEMDGIVPTDGGQNHHLVIALFAPDGARMPDAVARAQLSESGIVDAPPKYLTPTVVDGLASYGRVASTAKNEPHRFRIFVKLPNRGSEIEFAISARSPHRETR
jgi:hypothetical protein